MPRLVRFDNLKCNTPPNHAVWDEVSGQVAVDRHHGTSCELPVRRRPCGHDHRPTRSTNGAMRERTSQFRPNDVHPAGSV